MTESARVASWSCRAKPKTRGRKRGWEITISDLQKLGPPFQHHRECPAFLGQLSAPNIACIVQSAFLAVFTTFSCVFLTLRGQNHEHQLSPLGVLSQSFRALFRPGDQHHEHQLPPLGPHGRPGWATRCSCCIHCLLEQYTCSPVVSCLWFFGVLDTRLTQIRGGQWVAALHSTSGRSALAQPHSPSS